ncbi:MAG: hypothetical protein HY824_15540 [Acidobacteria bacterium]|nr:hypothetical protein [Acidobacteriota bacterium]
MTYTTPLALAFSILLLAPGFATGQAFWPRDTPKLPMAKTWVAEKAKLPPYTAPRTRDGVPDLQGVWNGAGGDNNSYLEDHEYVDGTTPSQESFVSDPTDGKVPYQPWALAKRNEILRGLARGWPGETGEHLHVSPGAFCLNYMPVFSFDAQEIVQKPGSVIMLSDDTYRVIPTDGRPAVSQSAKFWLGVSRGRWDGDTLVVEVTGLNGRGWFDSTGQFYSENTRMIERWRLVDANTIDYQVTIEDPTIYTRPRTMTFPKRRPGTGPRGPRGTSIASSLPPVENNPYDKELWERACYEGNDRTVIGVHSLGFKWFSGVTPPK